MEGTMLWKMLNILSKKWNLLNLSNGMQLLPTHLRLVDLTFALWLNGGECLLIMGI
jgi:hypothetical protein